MAPRLDQRRDPLLVHEAPDEDGVVAPATAEFRIRVEEVGFDVDLLRREASLDKLLLAELGQRHVGVDLPSPRAQAVVGAQHRGRRRRRGAAAPVARVADSRPREWLVQAVLTWPAF